MKPATASMLRIERGVAPLGLVVGKVAMHREVVGVFQKLRAPGQHGPGETKDHQEGQGSSHTRSIQ